MTGFSFEPEFGGLLEQAKLKQITTSMFGLF
jgi:hypothetical protein